MEVGERRQHRRLELDLPLTVVQPGSSEPLRARLKDISQGGCFFTVGAAVKAEGRITIDFVVLPRAICNATGRVVRGRTGDGFGVEFGATNDALQKFVARLETASAGEREAVLARILDPEIHLA
ncbi:MAG TPA: PilZ domain-containing protein [Polyangia bacterium]